MPLRILALALISLSGLGLAGLPVASAQVIIHEIHHSPVDKTVHEEFVEIHNTGTQAVDLSGWSLTDAVRYEIPAGTSIGPGGYVVIAQDPVVLESLYGTDFTVVGPFEGRLSGESDEVRLRDADGFLVDVVDYRNGFPWPTLGGDRGYSMELVHPSLSNDLGGSWRASNPDLVDTSGTLIQEGSTWRHRPGDSAPPASWRQAGFDDSGWSAGRTSIGYGDDHVITSLDMRGNYSSFYLRQTFDLEDASEILALTLEVQFDDGFNAYINGQWVAGQNVSSQNMDHDDTAGSALENFDFVSFSLDSPGDYLVDGTNVLAIHLLNASLGGSSDAWVDARLTTRAGAGSGPSPGRVNNTFSTSLPPQLRQVEHLPESPQSGELVKISIKATDDDGIDQLQLEYQIVEPGSYIRLTDPGYEEGWISVPMNDEGTAGDFIAGDDIYTAALLSDVQQNRRLVRYRITATDLAGNSITAPYADDPVPNFAYYVYDGVPAWTGSARPGVVGNVTYSPETLTRIPVYTLITQRQDRLNALSVPYRWGSPDQQTPTTGSYGGSDYRWEGTLIYDGKVYDHIRYRARGGVWRYSMGKNMWKFNFKRGHRLEARDDYGRRYDTRWDKLNFSALIQQGNFRQRGEQGLFEAVGFRLHNLTGNAAPYTHYVHYRVVESPSETGPDQFSGDFQGLYLAIEQPDGNLLDEHGLPDGNFYKMEGGTGELNNQGYTHPKDKSDLNTFKGTYESSSPGEAWWRANLELPDYYNFRTVMMAIHDYDVHAGKNYFFYHNPVTSRWHVINWDLDLTWTTTYNGGGGRGPLNQHVLDRFSVFRTEYRNRVREVRDLLFNTDQTHQLIDEVAHVVYQPGQASMVDADRAMWDYNPILVSNYINSSKASHGRFYENAVGGRSFAGMITRVKNYVGSRGSWMDTNEAADSSIPSRPTVTYEGPAGFPIDGLAFRSSNFADPQGSNTFAAMKWRIAEVTPPGQPAFDPLARKIYEIEPEWESEEISPFQSTMTFPDWIARPGERYRVRVRMKDNTDRWSRWSNPVEFTATEASTPFPQQEALRITEIMYNHPLGSDLEFLEITNRGPAPVDLTPVSLVDGINFDFAEGDVSTLNPGEYVLVVKNPQAFLSYYQLQPGEILLAGEYDGRLANGGEKIKLRYGKGTVIQEFTYDDLWHPLTDGGGHSLTIVDPDGPLAAWGVQEGWRESGEVDGSPGHSDSGPPPGGWQRPGDTNRDDFLDIGDAVALLLAIYRGESVTLPCEGDTIEDGGNLVVADFNDDGLVDSSDAIHLLTYLYLDGPAHHLGTGCTRVEGCPDVCTF